MRLLTKNFFPLFSCILVISIIGFATSLSVSLPQRLGLGSAVVEAPPGVSVTSVTWILVDNNPILVDKMNVTVYKTTTGSLNIYFVVKDVNGVVLQVTADTLPYSVGSFTYQIDLDPNRPASSIGSVAVTVIPP
jgi:hypothetical protein